MSDPDAADGTLFSLASFTGVAGFEASAEPPTRAPTIDAKDDEDDEDEEDEEDEDKEEADAAATAVAHSAVSVVTTRATVVVENATILREACFLRAPDREDFTEKEACGALDLKKAFPKKDANLRVERRT